MFFLKEFRATANSDDWSNDENAYASSKLLWKAPEHLRNTSAHGTPKGDSYSFGIILYEIFGRAGPYGDTCVEAEEIIEQVRDGSLERNWFRPDLGLLKDSDLDYKAEDYILGIFPFFPISRFFISICKLYFRFDERLLARESGKSSGFHSNPEPP